jgi:hypothetical protein
MLGFGITYQLKPGSYIVRILTEGPLIVVLAIELYSEVRAALDERTRLVWANIAYITLRAQRIGHISHLYKPRGKSTLNKVNNMLSNHVLFKLS